MAAVVAWLVASLGFSLYVGHFGNYEAVYGALGSVIVLLLSIWISALAVLSARRSMPRSSTSHR